MSAFTVAIEGGDGVGKNTIANALASSLRSKRKKVSVIDFPRYKDTLAGSALTQFLNGETRRPVTAEIAAVLYALDRFEYREDIERSIRSNDVVIFDRYVASNVAYQGAKVPLSDRTEMMDWVARLELETFALPKPDLNVLLRLDVTAARQLVGRKPKRAYTELVHDIHEADDALQTRLRENYELIAERGMISSWSIIDVSNAGTLRTPSEICAELESNIEKVERLTSV